MIKKTASETLQNELKVHSQDLFAVFRKNRDSIKWRVDTRKNEEVTLNGERLKKITLSFYGDKSQNIYVVFMWVFIINPTTNIVYDSKFVCSQIDLPKPTFIFSLKNTEPKQVEVLNNTINFLTSMDFYVSGFGGELTISKGKARPTKMVKGIDGNEVEVVDGIRLTKMKSQDSEPIAAVLLLHQTSDDNSLYYYLTLKLKNIEKNTNISNPIPEIDKFLNAKSDFQTVNKAYSLVIAKLVGSGFVKSGHRQYIPVDANKKNWDFEINGIKLARSNKNIVEADFSGYHPDNIPDQIVNSLGTSSLDYSQISSRFGKTNSVIDLVNSYDGNLLKNIVYIFDFSKPGSFGVYVPALDEAIKNKKLFSELEKKGYEIVEEGGSWKAVPKTEQKSNEEIQNDINQIYNNIKKIGGTSFGINISRIMANAQEDFSSISKDTGFKHSGLLDLIIGVKLGGTIVHEAVHALGNDSEGPSEQAERGFQDSIWAKALKEFLTKVSSEKSSDGEKSKEWLQYWSETGNIPLNFSGEKRHATSKARKVVAQSPYLGGSDLEGRHGRQEARYQGMQMGFGRLDHLKDEVPLEVRLWSAGMTELPEDLDIQHDSTEERLRKTTRDMGTNPNQSYEELLSEFYEDIGYESVEKMLSETRPKPLMTILNSSTKRQITSIDSEYGMGYFSNLSFPYQGGMVYDEWSQWQESINGSEQDIRKQPRYNPTYDSKGFYYQWIDPKSQIRLFDDPSEDSSISTHPAKRFAQENSVIANVLLKAYSKITNGDMPANRLLVSHGLVDTVLEFFNGKDINTLSVDEDDGVIPVWIYTNEYSKEDVIKAEGFFRGDTKSYDLIMKMLNLGNESGSVASAFHILQNICLDNNYDVYIMGDYVSNKVFKKKGPVKTILLFSKNKQELIQMFEEFCDVENLKITNVGDYDILYTYRRGILIKAYTGENEKLKELLKSQHIKYNEDFLELYNNAFTANMFAYRLNDMTPITVNKTPKIHIENKIAETLINPDILFENNPLLIIDLVELCKDHGFSPSERVKSAAHKHIIKLKDILKGKKYLSVEEQVKHME